VKSNDALYDNLYWPSFLSDPRGETAALFLPEITSWMPSWKCDVISEILLRQSMSVYLKNNPAKVYPDPFWNDVAVGFLMIWFDLGWFNSLVHSLAEVCTVQRLNF